MDLFSRATMSHHCDHLTYPFGNISCAAVSVSRGLYLAVIVGIIMILAMGSILAVQMRPYAMAPAKILGGHPNQPRLVDSGSATGNNAISREGGDDNGRII